MPSHISLGQVRDVLLANVPEAKRLYTELVALAVERDPASMPHRESLGTLLGRCLTLDLAGEPRGDVFAQLLSPAEIVEPPTHQRARAIMENAFHGIPENAVAFGALNPAVQAALTTLAKLPFNEATLYECRDTHLLIADLGYSVEELCRRACTHLGISITWDREKPFAQAVAPPRWRLIRRIFAQVAGLPWEARLQQLNEREVPVTARELLYMATVSWYVNRGSNLGGLGWMRTANVDEAGRRLCVATFGTQIDLRAIPDTDTDVPFYLGVQRLADTMP